MPTIALVSNSPQWLMSRGKNLGGGNIVAYNIFTQLKNLGWKITIISPGNKNNEYIDGVDIIYINYPIGSIEFTKYAQREANKYDKIINFMTQNIFDGVIIQSHSYFYRTTRTNKLLIPIKRLLYKKKINYQKNLFSSGIKYAYAVSNGIKNDFETNFGIKNITVSYPGCNEIYKEFNPHKNAILTFGLIANSSVNKGGNYTIFALGIAKLLGLKFKFNIIAPKYSKDILMKFLIKICGLKKVTNVLPKQDDMTDFYNSIDCAIMPSIHESFGLVPLEAMSFCKTCLVSDNIGFAELIDENSGFKFNRLSFISYINSLLNVGKIFYKNEEKYNMIRKNGWEISRKHNWENFVKDLLK